MTVLWGPLLFLALLFCDPLTFLFSFTYSEAAWVSKIQRDCELEALNIGSRLADRYNSLDEETEWDTRIHHDYLTKHLGFAGWIQIGLWKNTQLTALRQHAPTIHKVNPCENTSYLSQSFLWRLLGALSPSYSQNIFHLLSLSLSLTCVSMS